MRMLNDDDLLYHYTSAEGLLGIAGTKRQKGAFWLTQIQYMNDREEWYHAFRLAQSEIAKSEPKSSGLREALRGIFGINHDDSMQIDPDIRMSAGFSRVFVLSLTEDGDLLSQWRGYASNGGYSLGFRVGDLKKLAINNGLALVPCIYADDIKLGLLRSEIEQVERSLEAGEIDPNYASSDIGSVRDRALQTARVRLQNVCYSHAVYLKHASFAEEREWRITGGITSDDERARWRTRGNMIIPYCEIPIDASSLSPVPVREVIIGPAVDDHLAQHAIQLMDFPANALGMNIRRSASTLRA